MAKLLPTPKWRYFKDDGTPASGWVVYTYEVGGAVTAKATYTTSAADVSNGASFTLDSRGEADVWWDGLYYIAIYKSAAEGGGLVDTIDNYGDSDAGVLVAPNLIGNGSFEEGVDGTGAPEGWTVTTYTGGSFAVDDTDSVHGGNSAKGVTVGNGGAQLITEDFTPCSEYESLFWKFLLKSSVVDIRNLVEIVWYDADQALLSATSIYDESAANPTSWTAYQGIAVPVSTARYFKVRITLGHSSDASAGTARIDGVELRTSPMFGASKSLVLEAAVNYAAATDSGTDTYTCGLTPALLALVTGMEFAIDFADANTTTTPSLNINSLGAKTIVRPDDSALVVGDINGHHILRYDGTNLIVLNPIYPKDGASLGAATATTPIRTDDDTSVTTTEWVRDTVVDRSGSLSVMKCGAVNIPQAQTRYLKAVGDAVTATETETRVPILRPTEVYQLLVTFSEAIASGQSCEVVLRKNGADSTILQTINGPTTAGQVTTITGSEIYGPRPGSSGTVYDDMSVEITTSASFGSTNDIKVAICTKVPGTNYAPASPLCFYSKTGGVGTYAAPGEFGSNQSNATAATVRDRAFFPVKQTAVRKIATKAATTMVCYHNDSTSYASAGDHLDDGDTLHPYETTTNAATDLSLELSDVENGGFGGLWAPVLFSSISQAQGTALYMGGYQGIASATFADVAVPMPACTLKNLRAAINSALTGSETATFTVYYDSGGGVTASSITTTLDSSNSVNSDTSNSLDIAAGTLVAVLCTSSASAGTHYYHAALDLFSVT